MHYRSFSKLLGNSHRPAFSNAFHCWFSASGACISVAMRIYVCVFRPVLAPFALDLICIIPLDLMHFARVDPWADKTTQSSCLVVDYQMQFRCIPSVHMSPLKGDMSQVCTWCQQFCGGVKQRVTFLSCGCMFSAISFLYDPLSRSRMCSVCASERELQFLYLLCWILFVLFHWILCISPVSIHELTRLHSLVVLWSTTLMWQSMSTASSGA